MIPVLPTTWVKGEKVPFQEGSTVEFKEVTVFSGLFRPKSAGNSGLPKYRETLIGFLNSGQGILVMGIKDDGTIAGVEDTSPAQMDMLRLWVDGNFNTLVYKNGKPIDPSKISIKHSTYPVVNHPNNGIIIVITAINNDTHKHLDIMTRSGTVVHRLNASNFKLAVEPIYRKRDVKGMVYAVRLQMQSMLADKKRQIEDLQEQHTQHIKKVISEERTGIRDYIDKISISLYEKYKYSPNQQKESMCNKLMKYLSTLIQSSLV
jgi:hypothetical protein